MDLDINEMSDEQKNALIEHLLKQVAQKSAPPPDQNISKPAPRVGAIKGSIPVNQIEHVNKFEDIVKTVVVPDDERLRKHDKELAKRKQPTERREASTKINVRCRGCGGAFEVLPHLAQRDRDLGWIYYCNNCSRRG